MKTTIIAFCIAVLFLGSCKKEKKDMGTLPPGQTTVLPKNYLSSNNYDKLVVEIQFVYGLKPSPTAMDNLKMLLLERLNKPAGIEFVYTTIDSPGKQFYSVDDIQALEERHRTITTDGKKISAYMLFIDGDHAQNSGNLKTLGFAYGPSSMVIFEKTLRDLSGGLGQPSEAAIETAVSEHEFCHILGLVNNGSPLTSAHQDEAHGKHCSNTGCLMHYATETSDIIGNLLGNNIPALDQNCINDLKANGGK